MPAPGRHLVRRAAVCLALLASAVPLLAACAEPVAPPPSASSPAAHTPRLPRREPDCAPDQLAVTVERDGHSGDQTFWVVAFTDRGAACGIRGFPAVVAATSSGSPVGAAAASVRDHFSPRVVLRPGQRATASLFSRDIAPDGAFAYEVQHHLADTCHAAPADGFAVTPPDAVRPRIVRVPHLRSCTGRRPWMAVTAIEQ